MDVGMLHPPKQECGEQSLIHDEKQQHTPSPNLIHHDSQDLATDAFAFDGGFRRCQKGEVDWPTLIQMGDLEVVMRTFDVPSKGIQPSCVFCVIIQSGGHKS